MPPFDPCSLSTATKTALLDAAERLFAELGIAGASLRAITGAADANIASVNYHFGSKQGLVRAVFARRLRPLNRQRLELLARLLAEGERDPELWEILDAFVRPVLTMLYSGEPGSRDFVRLMGRAIAESDARMRSMLLEEFSEVIESFSAALGRALPKVPPAEIAWRFHFMVGALAHTVAASQMLSERLRDLGVDAADDVGQVSQHLVSFLEGGWRAPAAGQARRGARGK